MKISRNMKKLMSSFMVTALFFASLFIVQPVKAVAADSTPTVTILDATLRLNDATSEVEGMRFAIKVSNADKAKDCGITIKANGQTKTVSVSGGDQKLYSKEGNTVIYSAVVTGIPASYKASDFEFSGFVTPIEGTTPVTTATTTKTLEQVAQATGYDISVEGDKIVAREDEGDELTPASWNAGQVSLAKNLGGKKVKISFQMKVKGAESVVMNFQTNYGGSNGSNPGKWSNTINNTWTPFDFEWVMPTLDDSYPAFYLNPSEGSTYNKESMKFYIKDFSVTPVGEESGNENSVVGTALKEFSNYNGDHATFTTVHDATRNKTVPQLTILTQYQSTGIVVKFTLPEGKTLADYDTLSVDLNSNGQGWKQMGVDWRENEGTQTGFGDSNYGAYIIHEAEEQRYPSNGNEWKTETFSLDYDVSGTDITTKQEGQDVYLGIMYNWPAADTTVMFDNIILSKSN